jgi:hypothetical protein
MVISDPNIFLQYDVYVAIAFDIDSRYLPYNPGAGKQGFQNPLMNDSFVVDGMGPLGNTQTERGLTYFEVSLSGHM